MKRIDSLKNDYKLVENMKKQLGDLLFSIKPHLRDKHKIAIVDDLFPELENIKEYLLREIGKESVND